MVEPSGLQGTDEEDEVRFLETRNEDLILVDKTQHSTADEEEEGEEDDESESEEDKMGLSNSASMLRIMRSLPEAEARRYEHFRRSHFERGAIKRCMAQAIHECSATDKKVAGVTNVMAIVMAGISKVFVSEITSEARRIMEMNGETGPIRPRHLRQAHWKYYKRRPLARGRHTRRLLR